MDEVILTPDQVAQILQVHPFTVLKFIKQGKLKASKLGRVYRIRRTDVDAFLNEQATRAAPEIKELKTSKGEKSKKNSKIGKVSPSKEISGDSSLTDESEEVALKENKKLAPKLPPAQLPPPKEAKKEEVELPKQDAKETAIVTDRDEEATPHRNQEDHYVIELKL